ncbi:MAG: c-type cytochrome, partial [Planctomycetes bacterium]|nr:c-type cytochrome [Planctomycetota bacterium]
MQTVRLSESVVLPWMRAATCIAVVLSSSAAAGADERTGEQIYRQMCASCHGPAGEGTEENHPDALAGDKSVAQLAEAIAETMPEDDPGTCTGDDAERVAAYIYDAFYSPAAQARNKPPRIELSRLTVRQYQNAVVDLIGSFSQPGQWGDERGLHGEYYDSRRTRRDQRVMERIDATVDFDYEAASPDPEKIGTDEFSASWEGSILAPDTGDYEFILETKNG